MHRLLNERVAETVAESAPDSARAAKKATPRLSRGQRLAKLARTHALVFLAALSAFAAADSWSMLSGLGIAGLLCVITGALAGVTTATLVHEWFHYLGARYVRRAIRYSRAAGPVSLRLGFRQQ